jgi:hypothetical protein
MVDASAVVRAGRLLARAGRAEGWMDMLLLAEIMEGIRRIPVHDSWTQVRPHSDARVLRFSRPGERRSADPA